MRLVPHKSTHYYSCLLFLHDQNLQNNPHPDNGTGTVTKIADKIRS